MVAILGDLFVNLVIIVASITLGNLIYRDHITIVDRRHTIIISVLCGILGCLIMLYSVRVSANVIVDFRCIPIIIMGLYCTIYASITTAVIIGIARIIIFGFSAASIASLVVAILMAVACGLIGKTKLRIQIKWILAYLAVTFIAGTGFVLLIKDISLRINVITAFSVGLIVVSTATYYVKKYNQKSNEQYYIIEKASNIDFLTGLHNVRHYDKTLNDHLITAKSTKSNVSLLFIDVDYFKKVNDTYGHLNGDRVLHGLGKLLMLLSRGDDVITRKGGEEFTVLLSKCKLEEAVVVAERIREEIEKHSFISSAGEIIKITVSVGVSSYPETTAEEDKLSEQADIALYKAKRTGRNKVCTAEPSSCRTDT